MNSAISSIVDTSMTCLTVYCWQHPPVRLCFGMGTENRRAYRSLLTYQNKNKETGEYCYVTVGTQADDVEDYITDVSHFLSNVTSQYVESMIYASNLSAAIGTKSKLSYSGHSLGGALAVCNSLVTGNSATTFNPAGISCRLYDFYAETFGFKGDEANITNYIMQGDIVNIANLFDKEIGTYHMMYHENGGFGGHSIDNFLEPTFTFTELLKKIYK